MKTELIVRSLLLLASAVFAFVAWWRRAPRDLPFFRRLGVLLGAACITEVIGLITMVTITPNGLLYSSYAVVEFLLVLSLVQTVRPSMRKWLTVCGVVGTTAVCLDMISRESFEEMATMGIVITASLSTISLILVLWHLAETVDGSLWSDPRTWVCLGLLLSYATIAPVMGSVNYASERFPHLVHNLYLIVHVMMITRYIMIGIGCMRSRTQPGHGRST